jgi:hypothetical protein
LKSLKGKDNLKYLMDNNIKVDHREIGCITVAGFICFRTGTGDRLL